MLNKKEPRRRRWLVPVIILGLIVLLVAAGVGWLFKPRIARWFEPRPTLPPEAVAEVGEQGGLLYETSFDDPAVSADWEIFDDGIISARVADGQLVVSVNSLQDTGAWSGLNYTFDDFVLDVDATKLDGPDDNGIIVIFRLTDTNNYNRFDISSDGYYTLSKTRDGVSTIVSDWNFLPEINQGATVNHMRVTAAGDTFAFEVNAMRVSLCLANEMATIGTWDPAAPNGCHGDLVDTWQDSDLPRGKVGLGAQGFVGFDGVSDTPAFAVIGFDNLVINIP